ncbi:MAG TPA: sugar porter family MFS transporter [Verrucomicrobiae bacterium]|nr:sugar porter family MFS transporter [Verrucomicrobiae bacterium]
MQNRFYMILIAVIVALGGFLLGFDATVISGAVPFLRKYFELTDLSAGWAVSCFGYGALGGYAVAGPVSDRFGRKSVLLLTAIFFTVSALLSALSTRFPVFVCSRILGGIALGGPLLIAPVYIAEIAPPKLRGSMVSINQLMIVLGISASFFSNYFLLQLGENSWRWMLGVEAAPAVLYFTCLFFVPESPRWLLLRGQESRARAVFTRVCGAERAESELRNIRESISHESGAPANLPSRLAALFGRRMRRIIFIALALAFFQMATGINAIFYYLPTIFSHAGSLQNTAFMQAALVGLVNVTMTLVAIWLIDRLGRKPLLALGAAGMAVSLLTCAWAFHASSYQLTEKSFALLEQAKVPAGLVMQLRATPHPVSTTETAYVQTLESAVGAAQIAPYRDTLVQAGLKIQATLVLVAIMGFVASFAISLGPVMWVLLSEIFPHEHRGMAISLVGFWNGLVSSSVTLIFPWELSHLGSGGAFLGYGLLAIATWIFVIGFIPETKGRSLEELELLLTPQPPPGKVSQPEFSHEGH